MKEYIKPEIKIVLFKTEDVIAASDASAVPTGRTLITAVNGNEGTNYGAQEVSIFDN